MPVKMRRQGKTDRIAPRRLRCFIVASGVFLLVLVIRFAYADQAYTPAKTEETPAAEPAQADATDQPKKGSSEAASTAKGQTFDPAVVSSGQAAFERSCTTCHDAARSLERSKDLASWRATVRRMAAKMGAEVATGD